MSTAQWMILLGVVLGSLGLWLMLPARGSQRKRVAGGALGAAALGLLASQFQWLGHWSADLLFNVLAVVTVVSAVGAVTMRSPVYCAIWFAIMLLGTAGLFLLAGAQFLSVATVVVYAGAILVTFLFVLMLCQPDGAAYYDRLSWEGMLASVAGALMIGLITLAVGATTRGTLALESGDAATVAARPLEVRYTADELAGEILAPRHVERLGLHLFSTYLVAIEVAGVLLLVALVGAAAIVAQDKLSASTVVAPGQPGPEGARRG